MHALQGAFWPLHPHPPSQTAFAMLRHDSAFLILFFAFSLSANAQVTSGLIAWYPFEGDSCQAVDALGTPTNNGFLNGDISCGCGVVGNAMYFDGVDDYVVFPGTAVNENYFNTTDFTISFYFKPTSQTSQDQVILSRRDGCGIDHAFAIRYNPFSRNLSVLLSEAAGLNGTIAAQLPPNRCWYHVAVVRVGARTRLYIDARLVGEVNALQRVDLSNDTLLLTLGASNCTLERPFEGFIDELRLYGKALTADQIATLFFQPDQIGVDRYSSTLKDTIIYLGNSVATWITPTCATDFAWQPTTGVEDPTSPYTLITPEETTLYSLSFSDAYCTAVDSLRITVIDPSTLDCTEVLVPGAFTPNGDGLNDTWGLSNPFVIEPPFSLEIYDRWGSRIFFTDDPYQRWDGTWQGQPVNPGILLYRVQWHCKGEERLATGSLTVLR